MSDQDKIDLDEPQRSMKELQKIGQQLLQLFWKTSLQIY